MKKFLLKQRAFEGVIRRFGDNAKDYVDQLAADVDRIVAEGREDEFLDKAGAASTCGAAGKASAADVDCAAGTGAKQSEAGIAPEDALLAYCLGITEAL